MKYEIGQPIFLKSVIYQGTNTSIGKEATVIFSIFYGHKGVVVGSEDDKYLIKWEGIEEPMFIKDTLVEPDGSVLKKDWVKSFIKDIQGKKGLVRW